jgi:hypothetical protein
VLAESSFSPSVSALLELSETIYEQAGHVLISIYLLPTPPRGVVPEGSGGAIGGITAALDIPILQAAIC